MYLWHHWTMALRRSTLIDIGVYMLVIVVGYLYGHVVSLVLVIMDFNSSIVGVSCVMFQSGHYFFI